MNDPILTVLIAATTHDLTTLDTAKEDAPSTGISDAIYARYIREASHAIRDYLGRTVAEEKVAETWRCVEASLLRLNRYPVSTVHSVVEDGTTLAGTDYEIDAGCGLIYRLSGDTRIDWCFQKLTITYTAGYALLDSVPFALETACLAMIKNKIASRGRDPALKRLTVEGVGTEEYWVGSLGDNAAMPPDVEALLEPFREIRL